MSLPLELKDMEQCLIRHGIMSFKDMDQYPLSIILYLMSCSKCNVGR